MESLQSCDLEGSQFDTPDLITLLSLHSLLDCISFAVNPMTVADTFCKCYAHLPNLGRKKMHLCKESLDDVGYRDEGLHQNEQDGKT